MSSNTSNASRINVRIAASRFFSNGDVVSSQQPSVSAGSGRRASVSDPALNSELRAYFSQLLLLYRCTMSVDPYTTCADFCSIAPIGFGNTRCRCACNYQLCACSSQTVRTVTCVIDASSHPWYWYCWTAICCNALAVKSVSHSDDSESTIQLTTTQSVAICTSIGSGTCCCLGRGSLPYSNLCPCSTNATARGSPCTMFRPVSTNVTGRGS